LVKAMKEIEGIDLSHVEKLVALLNIVKTHEQPPSQTIKG
jgi:hypothetical protein